MRLDSFFSELVECMEIGPVKLTEESVFKEFEGFDSMAILSIVALVDENFGKTLDTDSLQNMVTVHDLIELIGREHFETK